KAELAPIAPHNTELLPCATEKLPFFLEVDAQIGAVVEVSDDFEDDLLDALDEDEEILAVSLSSAEELDNFADCQYMISKPLCLVCDDAEVLEGALRRYQGRALYEGSLDENALLPLAEKYGLII
ncbi:MAG: hypothetical protein IJZ91_03070, partial [Oscillospiraceae bacterium]|nr:hypothetical protein [Oscillospiraceae bacterium]